MRPGASSPLGRLVRAFGPAIAPSSPVEALRAGLGAMAGLAIAGLWALSPVVDLKTGLFLVAPFGATSVLLFAVPSSPLAQPWSVVAGNAVSAVAGVAACLLVPDPALRVAAAAGAAIVAMSLLRAMHPPGGAVALTAALNPDMVDQLGFGFALTPVAAGSALLVAMAALYARATGRRYPARSFPDAGQAAPPPPERLGLSEAELTGILQQYRQSLNLGAADLARLIGAAEMQAAGRRAGPLTAQDVMSRDPVSVRPETPLSAVADLFRSRGFTTLPVAAADGRFLGMIFQIHLIRRAREDALRLDRGFAAAMTRLTDPERRSPPRARDIMAVGTPRATRDTPAAALLPMLAEGSCDAVPVVEYGRVVGIVTRTDLIAALARRSLAPGEPPAAVSPEP